MLLRADLATGQVAGESISVHDLGTAGRLYFSGRCRLDNRRELLGRLQLSPSVTDAELIVQAYLAFGESHPEALLGDFAYALFDTRDRRLWLVRDHMGVIPLYYHRSDDLCIASHSLDAMLDQPEIPRDLDDGVVAEWCANGHVYNQIDTFYIAIKKVPRATRLRLGATRQQSSVYWSPAGVAPLVETRESVLVEQLHDLIQTAILCRLGTTGGQAAHLSGGLDSTPIATVAGRACRRRGQEFHTYNWCRPEAGDTSDRDEWADARRVARDEGFRHSEIKITPDTLAEELLGHDLSRDGTTMFSYERQVVRQAQADGVTRIFSGFGGDEILTIRTRDRHYHALRAGRFMEVLRRVSLESDSGQLLFLPRIIRRYAYLLRHAWWPGEPPSHDYRRKMERLTEIRLTLLRPEFAALARDRVHQSPSVSRAERIADQQLESMNNGYHQERLESWAILGERHGIDYVYPYLDKRLVEFALALPSEWYFRRGRNRYLYREAMNDTLPRVIKIKSKLMEHHRVRQFMQSLQASLRHRRVLDRIADSTSLYVNPQSLLRQLERLQQVDTHLLGHHRFELRAAFDCTLTLSLIDKQCRPGS